MEQEFKDIDLNTKENGQVRNATREENKEFINYFQMDKYRKLEKQKRDRKNAVKKFIKENRETISVAVAIVTLSTLITVSVKDIKKMR